MNHLKEDVQMTMLNRIPVMLLSFLSVIFLTRLLGPEGNGIYTFCMAVLNLFFTVAGFQLEAVLPIFLAKHKTETPKIFSAVLLLAVCSFFAFVILLTSMVFFLPGGHSLVIPEGQSVPFFFCFLILAFALRRINTLVLATLRGMFSFKRFNVLILINQLLPVMVYGTLLFISFSPTNPFPYLFYFKCILMMESALALCGILILWRAHIVSFARDTRTFTKPITVLSAKSLLSSSGHFLNKRLDVWFVQYFSGTASLGQYGLATQIANFISDAMTPFSQVLVPHVAGTDETQHRMILERSARINMLIATLSACGIAATSWLFIPLLFGHDFKDAVPATQVLAIGVIFISQRLVFTGYFKAINAMRFAVRAAWAGVIITIVLDLCLIPPLGILGAAIATTIAYGTSSAYLVYVASRRLGSSIRDILLIRREDLRWILQRNRDRKDKAEL